MADTQHSRPRFSQTDVDTWSKDGAVLIENFFRTDEITLVHDEFVSLYGTKGRRPEEEHGKPAPGQFNAFQFQNIDNMPFQNAPHLSLLGVHPALIEFARAALRTEDVYLYQSHSWAKYSGDTDYTQPFHCDFKNHTLTVPSDDVSLRTINIMIYASDVTLRHGAISYVPQSISDQIVGEDRKMFLGTSPAEQAALEKAEQRGVGKAGSIFAYGIDVYHRGMNLTAPDGYRFTLTASFKAAGNDMIGYTAWPFHFMQPWHYIFDTATPNQLACLGVPRPGDPFWTERTLRRAQERWPNWDMSAYRTALSA